MESATELRFDPMDPEYTADPYPILRRFRETQPIHYWDPGKGWLFFRYRDTAALMRDPRLVQDPTLGAGLPPELVAAYPEYAKFRQHDLFFLPSVDHIRIRRLVNPFFGPRALEAHRPAVEAVIAEVLDEVASEAAASGVINAAGFARRYPVRVIAGLLNIPRGHEDAFLKFADALIATITPSLPPEVFAGYMPAISEGLVVIAELLEARRRSPHEGDLFSRLIHACDADERLSDPELFSLVGALLVGGSDTTVSLTSYAILELLRHPDQLARLRQDPALARSAVDETLRYNVFGRLGLPRFATETLEYEGVTIHRGQTLYMMMGSAFRDPALLADADTYDIGRQHNQSPWFGWGPHFCLGASLARLETSAALRLFFERFPAATLAGTPVYGQHPMFRNLVELPVAIAG